MASIVMCVAHSILDVENLNLKVLNFDLMNYKPVWGET